MSRLADSVHADLVDLPQVLSSPLVRTRCTRGLQHCKPSLPLTRVYESDTRVQHMDIGALADRFSDEIENFQTHFERSVLAATHAPVSKADSYLTRLIGYLLRNLIRKILRLGTARTLDSESITGFLMRIYGVLIIRSVG